MHLLSAWYGVKDVVAVVMWVTSLQYCQLSPSSSSKTYTEMMMMMMMMMMTLMLKTMTMMHNGDVQLKI